MRNCLHRIVRKPRKGDILGLRESKVRAIAVSDLIEKLRSEHEEIIRTLKEAKELCVSSLPGHEKLMSVRSLLFDHLAAEDEFLYPLLRDAASGSDRLRKVIDEFEEGSHEVRRRSRAFFERYDMECSDMEFIRDFALIMLMLIERLALEEQVLYQEFDRLTARGRA